MNRNREICGITLDAAEVLSECIAMTSVGSLVGSAGAIAAGHGSAAVTYAATAAACAVFFGAASLIIKMLRGRER